MEAEAWQNGEKADPEGSQIGHKCDTHLHNRFFHFQKHCLGSELNELDFFATHPSSTLNTDKLFPPLPSSSNSTSADYTFRLPSRVFSQISLVSKAVDGIKLSESVSSAPLILPLSVQDLMISPSKPETSESSVYLKGVTGASYSLPLLTPELSNSILLQLVTQIHSASTPCLPPLLRHASPLHETKVITFWLICFSIPPSVHQSVHSAHKFLLIPYYKPSTVLDLGTKDKPNKIPVLMEFTFQWGHRITHTTSKGLLGLRYRLKLSQSFVLPVPQKIAKRIKEIEQNRDFPGGPAIRLYLSITGCGFDPGGS